MKRLVRWIVREKPIVIAKEEILKILFHRGRMLLLDQVTITEGKAVGEFTVPAENCDGHEPIAGMPVMRGVEIIEMAFQLLGIMVAKNPELVDALKGKAFVAREVVGAKFSGLIRSEDKLILEVGTDVDVDEAAGILKITSGTIIARVDGKKKGMVAAVVITGFDPAMINGTKSEAS